MSRRLSCRVDSRHLQTEAATVQRTAEAAHEWLGDSLESAAGELRDFARSSGVLSSDRDLAQKYAQKWIAVYGGEVRAVADELDTLLEELDELDVPRSSTAVRYMEKEPRTLILCCAPR